MALVALSVPWSGAAAAECAEVKEHRDGWTEIRTPTFSGDADLLDVAVPNLVIPGQAPPMLATNGYEVMRSTDGGCTWEITYSVSRATPVTETPLDLERRRIVAMRTSPARMSTVVYLAIKSDSRPIVVTSANFGVTWSADQGVGLPPSGVPTQLRVTTDPRRAYVVIDALLTAAPGRLYETRNSGATWELKGELLEGPPLLDFIADPADPDTLWGWSATGLFRSDDAGTTWVKVNDVTRPVRTVGLYHYPPVDPAIVTAYDATAATALRSRDGGKTWRPMGTGEPVNSSAYVLNNTDAIEARATDYSVSLTVPGYKDFDVTPSEGAIGNLFFTVSFGTAQLWGTTTDGIWMLDLTPQFRPPTPPPPPPPVKRVNLVGGGKVRIEKSQLRPAEQAVTLQIGEERTLRYELDMAPTPTPLDIFFLTDSTGSMNGVINGLRSEFQDIINDLAARGIDAWFGVGDFRDYPVPGWAQPTDYPYKRRRAVGPIDEDLRQALQSIQTGGGSGDDSALAATYFAATGFGQAVAGAPGVPATPGTPYWVEPNTGAEFRSESLKVLVVAADVESRDPQRNPGYPGPSYAKTIAALNARKIKHVGLAVGFGADSQGGPRRSLTKVSRGTQTLAPEGGVDCDGDDEIDIDSEQPLVCSLVSTAGSVAPAMVGLLSAVKDLQPVDIVTTGDRRVLKTALSMRYEDIDVKQANRLSFDVVVRCDAETAGTVYPVEIEASTPTSQLGRATATVTCVKPPVPPEIFPAAPIVPVVAAAAAPPPPPPPAPNINPNPNPNPNPQPNPQVNPQTGMAAQEDEQIQLAYAGGTVNVEEEELAMVGLDRPDPGPAVVWAAAAVAAAAAGWHLATRSAPARAYASRRR